MANFELANQSFDKIFSAVERKFTIFDKHIDSAEYDLALALLPKIKKVLEEGKTVTQDIGGHASLSEFTQAIIDAL